MDIMNRRKFLGTVAASPLVLSCSTLPCQAERATKAPVIRRPSDEFMASLPRLMDTADLPGLGIGVVQEDQLVWEHYAGVANADTKAPIKSDSLFVAGSLGKPLFTFAVLRLVDEGKLDLDRPLKEYIRDDAPTGERGGKITARHVLSHSSGLVNWRQPDEPFTPMFDPGSRFSYSGEGIYYLQRCVEKITGIGFEQFIQDRTMKPLGMTSSTYLWCADASKRYVAGHREKIPFSNAFFAETLFKIISKSDKPLAAWNHDRIVEAMAEAQKRPRASLVPGEVLYPNAAMSLLTTVADYAAFLGRLVTPRDEVLDLKAATRAEMMKPHSRINGALSWGLGWGIEPEATRTYLWQWGSIAGRWLSFVAVHPESRSAIVVFTNGSNGLRIAERIVRAASGQEHSAFLWAA
jgi:CubicO group peptidase (beta-lactamase class C family)